MFANCPPIILWCLQAVESVPDNVPRLNIHGLGPTHDDLTYESIAEAYNLSLVLDDQTVSAMQSHYKTPNLSDSQLRMATIPKPSAVFRTAGLWIPLVQVRNVLILPGVPRLFQLMTDSWFLNELPEFIAQEKLAAEPRIRLALKTLKKESEIAAKLAEMQNQVIQQGISIGSYPKLFEDGSSYVIICLTGLKNQPEPLGSLAQKIIWEFDAVFSE